jgi:hypothetical protein
LGLGIEAPAALFPEVPMASVSNWDQHGIEDKIRAILAAVPTNPKHPSAGRQFLTTYQIVLEFERIHNNVVRVLGKPLGGKGTGQNALTIYFAGELAKRIADRRIRDIEIQFLAPQYIDTIDFKTGGLPMVATPHEASFPETLFRLCQQPLDQ